MRYWVGVTDNRWFKYLSKLRPDEVNFWQPSAIPPFTGAPVGLPFLFKLKRPYNHIAGGGFFVTYSRLPLSIAWEVFGEKNGCSSIEELRELIQPLTAGGRNDDDIGCTVLTSPFFLNESDWLADPPDWSSNIVRGKMFESGVGAGREIWRKIQYKLTASAGEPGNISNATIAAESTEKYGAPIEVRPRLGQSSFRVLVTEAYQRRCAITGETTLVALEAAHIVPYSGEGGHDVRNGLLLRADFHRLFDVGLVSVSPDYRIRVSPRIRETWFNGKVYYRLDNQPLSVVPTQPIMRPDPDRLEWHLKNRFQA
ncbi:HNH endonuclease [Geobacter sp. DSM 9736]|uniref:HNH endonuclease n=1 Tax=Geobacter sp. DSM 9736 TaxID=1277350 RepID=UPI000B5FB0ED|nr:HNH endonuclease [Geobacter sp. DSM 9736]SNB45904.1 putative restriction endonuclease [Geobacter sp. DSM 9736]